MQHRGTDTPTIRLRILLFALLTLATLLLTLVLVVTYSLNIKQREQAALIQLGDAVSGSAVSLVVDYIIEEDFVALDEICLGYADNPSVRTARIVDTTGKVLADSSALVLGKILPELPVSLTRETKDRFTVQQSPDALLFTRVAAFEGEDFGYILLDISTDEMKNHIQHGMRKILSLGVFFCCLGLLCSWFFALWLIRPLEQLGEMTEDISRGKRVVPGKGSYIREIDDLAHRFQRMGEKVSRREKALVASEKQYRDIFENALEGIFKTAAEGEFTHVNPKMAALLGYESTGDLLASIGGLKDPLLLSSGDMERLFTLLAEQGEVVQHEVKLTGKEGQSIQGSLNIRTLYDDDGTVKGYEGLLEDITRQKEAAQERLKLKKLESVGTLAGGIAHDFNNILAAILGNINMATLSGSLDARVQKYLDEAEKASLRAKGLTSRLLTFAKGGAPVKESANIGEIVRESADFALYGSNVSCVCQIPEDLYPVEVDKDQISQVIQNLVMNGDHAMPAGGTLTISCENCLAADIEEDFDKAAGQYIRIRIHDTGIGIAPETAGKVFDPYFSTEEKGSGLGLAVCHSIISQHNGDITFDSTVGEGTVFTLYLPALKERSLEAENPKSAGRDSGKARIMIMDDEEMVRNVAREMLTVFGYEVVEACDGEEAVTLFTRYQHEGNPIDLVIMDLTIPGGMGGKEAVGVILALDPDARVMVSSGYSSDPVMAGYREYGFSGAVAKPYQMQELVQKVEACLA